MNELQQVSRVVAVRPASTLEGPSMNRSLNDLAMTASSQQRAMTNTPVPIVPVGRLREEARRMIGFGQRVIDFAICCEAIHWVLHFANDEHNRYFEGSRKWKKTILVEWESDDVWKKQFPSIFEKDKSRSYDWVKFVSFSKLANLFWLRDDAEHFQTGPTRSCHYSVFT